MYSTHMNIRATVSIISNYKNWKRKPNKWENERKNVYIIGNVNIGRNEQRIKQHWEFSVYPPYLSVIDEREIRSFHNWYLFESISYSILSWLANNRWFINCHLENQNEKWPHSMVKFRWLHEYWIAWRYCWTISLSWLLLLSGCCFVCSRTQTLSLSHCFQESVWIMYILYGFHSIFSTVLQSAFHCHCWLLVENISSFVRYIEIKCNIKCSK